MKENYKESYIVEEAKKNDILGIYNLVHRDFIAKNFTKSQELELEKHKRWYEFWIESPYYLIYVLKDINRKIIGQIRYEIDGEIAIISIYIEKEKRGKGLGKYFLEETMMGLAADKKEVKLIVAYILEENQNSLNMFSSFGFLGGEKAGFNGIEHLIYTKKIKK